MKKLDIANALREIVANLDNRKYDGYNVAAHCVHGMGNDNIRSASTICGEYSKAELEDALHYFNETVLTHPSTSEIEVKEVPAPEATNLIGRTMTVKGSELGGEIVSINESVNTVWFVTPDSSDEWIPARIDQMEVEEDIAYEIHPLDEVEKVHTIATFNYNGISIVLIHNEGTNQIGHDEHYSVYMQSEHQAMQMQYLYLAQALGKFDECKTHALNWSVEDYRNEWFRTMKGGR